MPPSPESPTCDRFSARVFLNQRAARDPELERIIREAESRGARLHVTSPPSRFIEDLVWSANKEQGREIRSIICGGDGTVFQTLRGDPSVEDHPIGIVPFGTGNDFARALGLPLDNTPEAFRIALLGVPRPVDALSTGSLLIPNMVTAGPVARITRETPKESKDALGSFAYIIEALRKLSDLVPAPIRIETEALQWEGDALAVYVANGLCSGGGVPICPEASLTDGFLDILVIPAEGWGDLPAVLGDAIAGWLDMPEGQNHFVRGRAMRVTLELAEGTPISFDGEPITGDRFVFTVRPGALRLAVAAPH